MRNIQPCDCLLLIRCIVLGFGFRASGSGNRFLGFGEIGWGGLTIQDFEFKTWDPPDHYFL